MTTTTCGKRQDGGLVDKLQRLIRHHRQRVFDVDGARHTRAILRLKRTATFAALASSNERGASIRQGERYAGMGY